MVSVHLCVGPDRDMARCAAWSAWWGGTRLSNDSIGGSQMLRSGVSRVGPTLARAVILRGKGWRWWKKCGL